jgi:hypothetical protein
VLCKLVCVLPERVCVCVCVCVCVWPPMSSCVVCVRNRWWTPANSPKLRGDPLFSHLLTPSLTLVFSFSPSRCVCGQTIDRQQVSEKENKKLDQSVAAFLRLVSAHILLRPAHKALEYLLRRYR